MVLQRSYPNLGSQSLEYAHCPNCSKMFKSIDEDGKPEGIPENCKRCGCPMADRDAQRAMAWMDVQAEQQHDPALSDLARRARTAILERPEGQREYSDPED